ncbi:MAG: putative formate dehydrogenase [Clostridia bacterium 62_21]|nr:MAG: putative formate dehydrogenase [Clostridia bacterium 62_21]
MKRINRRDFLKSLGLGTASLGLFEAAGTLPAYASSAVSPVPGSYRLKKAKETATVCSYCGCGCGFIIYSEGDRVVYIEGDPDHPINEGTMCPKGAALTDVNTIVDENGKRVPNPRRVTKVLYRAPGAAKWEEKDWDWALAEIAKRVKKTRDATFEEKDANGVTVNRTQAIAHLGSAVIENEANYLIGKLMRACGLVKIDHCARL